MRVIEGVHAQVQHPVVRVFILKDHAVHGTGLELVAELLLAHEMSGVEVASVHADEVYQHQHGHHHCHDAARGRF